MQQPVTASRLRWRTAEPAVPHAKMLPLLRQAVAVAPHRVDLKLQLARMLRSAGAIAEIVDLLRPAAADDRAAPEALLVLGRAALDVGEKQLAVDALRGAASAGLSSALGYLAEALFRLNRPDEALDAAQRMLAGRPADFEALQVIAHVLFQRGEIDRLWRLASDLRSNGAWGGWLSAVATSTAATLGMEDDFKALCDPSRWFSTGKLAVPGDFNKRLADELLALRPSAKAMRIDGLESVGGPASQELFVALRQAVESYVAQRKELSDDPVMMHRPPEALLAGWAILTEDHKHHGWHIHQAGWISGVYYIEVPDIDCSRDELGGTIEFGPYPFSANEEKLRPYRWRVRPEPGLLLLFPSYFAHRTWPTRLPDHRICVAFDVRPVGPIGSQSVENRGNPARIEV
jgi:tetratricopeptide (TPR) repeat protein